MLFVNVGKMLMKRIIDLICVIFGCGVDDTSDTLVFFIVTCMKI